MGLHKKYHGWVREWGKTWRIECTGVSQEAVRKNLEQEFGLRERVSTLVLEEGDTPDLPAKFVA